MAKAIFKLSNALTLCLMLAVIAPILLRCKKQDCQTCTMIAFLFAFQLLFSSCKKQDCQTCTQMLSEDYYPARTGYPKTTSSSYYSCGNNNGWIGNQVNVQRFILNDTLVTKVLSVDCQ